MQLTTTSEKRSLVAALERYFSFLELKTNWRTEILAGLTTFITMAYIVFVNPAILHEAGMPIAAVTAATCCCAALGSILMGALAKYPIALAPGMGLNAYFTYTVVKHMGVPWQTALGAVFLSGVIFLLLTIGGIRQLLVSAIPHELHAAVEVSASSSPLSDCAMPALSSPIQQRLSALATCAIRKQSWLSSACC